MIDSADLQIMDILAGDARMPVLELSKRLGMPNSTVRKRIKRLEDSGIISFNCEVDMKNFPQILIMFVGIVVSHKQDGLHEAIFNIPNILHVAGSTGRYDFVTMFVATSRDRVVDVIAQINGLEAVARTESSLLLKDIGVFVKSDKFSKLYKDSHVED